MMIFASFWLANTWYIPATIPPVRDINGVLVSIGDTVYIKGSVVSINQDSITFIGTLGVEPTYPFPNQQAFLMVSSLSVNH